MGWKPKVTNWDILPLLIQSDGMDPQMFIIPRDMVKVVTIHHPRSLYGAAQLPFAKLAV